MLLRSGNKGQFILWPSEWPKQWRDPVNRRFQSGCDMLVGPCQCGRRHLPDDEDVEETVDAHGEDLETLSEWRERIYAARQN